MASNTVSVELPADVYLKLQRAAELTRRPLEQVLVSTINAALVSSPDLPAELADELAAMRLLSDKALDAASNPSLSSSDQERLHLLNQTAQMRPLTTAEFHEQEGLLYAYHRSILRRAQALAILQERGYPITWDSNEL